MDWNKLKQAGAQVADSAVRTAGTLYEKGKKEAKLVALDSKLGRAQRELGALVYSLRRTGEENEAFIEGLCEDIAAIEAKIAALRAGGATGVSRAQAFSWPGLQRLPARAGVKRKKSNSIPFFFRGFVPWAVKNCIKWPRNASNLAKKRQKGLQSEGGSCKIIYANPGHGRPLVCAVFIPQANGAYCRTKGLHRAAPCS
mgnify:CR=1 FL=1